MKIVNEKLINKFLFLLINEIVSEKVCDEVEEKRKPKMNWV